MENDLIYHYLKTEYKKKEIVKLSTLTREVSGEILQLTPEFVTIKTDTGVKEKIDFFEVMLPLSITKIKIANWFEIQKSVIDEIPPDTRWIFLMGENGFGKTLFLQAIAACLNGDDPVWGKPLKKQNNTKMNLELCINRAQKQPIQYPGTKEPQYNFSPPFAAYGASRLQIQSDSSKNEAEKRSSSIYSLFNDDGVLLNIEREMLDLQKQALEYDSKNTWAEKENEKTQEGEDKKNFNKASLTLREIKYVFKKLLSPYITEIDTTGSEVTYIEQDSRSPKKFSELASGMKTILAMVGDMIIRLFRKNPEAKRLKALTGIIIIDELENHLHVKLQRRLPKLLADIFPNVLFIASTHSPIPLLGAPMETLVMKVERVKEEAGCIRAKKIEVDFKNLLPNAMRTSDIFDFDEILPQDTELKNVSTEDDYKKYKSWKELKKSLGIDSSAQ